MRAAVALGIIAGIFEFIAYFGPILSAVPAIATGFLDGPEKAPPDRRLRVPALGGAPRLLVASEGRSPAESPA